MSFKMLNLRLVVPYIEIRLYANQKVLLKFSNILFIILIDRSKYARFYILRLINY